MTATNRFSLKLKRIFGIFTVALAIILTLSAATLFSYAKDEQSIVPGLDVEITLDKESYAPGESVTIMLSVTNNTGKKVENVSARYYIPDCFEVSDTSLGEIGELNSRQTVRTQIQATAKTAVGSSFENSGAKKDSTTLYIALIVISAAVFILCVSLLFIRERNRRKIAATISFVLALIFCISPFATSQSSVSADTSELVFADSLTYENAKAVISKLIANDYAKINPIIASGNTLTREGAAVICAIMVLGKNSLPAIEEDPFLDVSADSASAPYVQLSTKAGLVPSISAKRFDPSAAVSGYDFVKYVLRAAGFGADGEYLGQNARARVISDALGLPYTDASELLTEDSIPCSKALCFALSVMLNPSAEKTEDGNYTFTGASLISAFDGITEKKALAISRSSLVMQDGEKVDVRTQTLDDGAYTVTFLGTNALTIIKNFANLGQSSALVYSNGQSYVLGAGIEYTVPSPKNEYKIYKGLFRFDESTGARVFACGNITYTISEKALDGATYMLDAKISDKSLIDYSKTVTFIAKVEKNTAIQNMSNVLYVYQLSTEVSASYDAYNTELAKAQAINNDSNTFLPSAYQKFLETVSYIDASLPKDLTDTQESRDVIAQATLDLTDAINSLDGYILESYEELDKELERADAELAKEGEYSDDTFAALKKAVEDARSLSRELLRGEENRAQIKAAKDAVSDAMAKLKPSSICNYVKYDETLKIALSITNDDGKYNATEFSSFKKKIDKINKGLVRDLPKNTANQKIVDDARASLQDAIELLNAKLPCDYDALDSAIKEAEKLVEDDPENKDHSWRGSVFATFSTALKDAKGVKRGMNLGYGSTNQQTIDGAATALFNATADLIKNPNVSDADTKTKFKDALEAARAIKNENGEYTAESYTLFLATLTKLEENVNALGEIYVCTGGDKCTCKTKAVENASKTVDVAIERLKAPQNCDYSALDAKLGEIRAIDRTLYTPKSLAALDAALGTADTISRTLLADVLGDNQKIINDAVKALDDAKKALVEIKQAMCEVLSAPTKKEVASEGGTITEHYFIKVFFDGKEKEFMLDDSIAEADFPSENDIIVIRYGDQDIIGIEKAKITVGEYVEGTIVKELPKYVSTYKSATPKAGDKVVFFKNSADEVIFIVLPTEKIAEIVYSESKLTVAGKETPIAESCDFSAFTEKTLVKIIFAGKYAFSAEALTSVDVTVSLSADNKPVYKESAESEAKVLEASKTTFEADETSSLLTLDKLTKALQAEKSYTAKIYLDAQGKLIASGAITEVSEAPAPDQGGGETT